MYIPKKTYLQFSMFVQLVVKKTMTNVITRRYTTKNALTFFNRPKLKATESSVFKQKVFLKNDMSEFHISMYSYYVRDAIPWRENQELNPVIKRFDKMCYYTGPEKELFPSFVLLNCYKTFELSHRLTSENLKLASTLAWCFETIATAYLIEDDIMDDSNFRWKKMCYHKQKGIGLTALTDTKQLYMSAFGVLRKYFNANPSYVPLMNVLCEMMFVTSLGQSADTLSNYEFKKTRNLNVFSYKRYKDIVKCKTGYILYRAPPLAAMHLAQINSSGFSNDFLEISDEFALYRQAQDDVWDVYGDFNYTGKVGSDISNGKCTWLIVTAIQNATKDQFQLLQNHYGQEQPNSRTIVLQVYKEIDVLGKFQAYKCKLLQKLTKDIDKLSFEPLRKLCREHVEQYINIDENFRGYQTE